VIVKVQMPLADSRRDAQALVYNEDRSYRALVPVTRTLSGLMAGRPKAYLHADIVTIDGSDVIEFGLEAPWQEW